MPRHYEFFVYIAANVSRTLYTGVTNDLERRMAEHRNHVATGFTTRYGIDRLIYFESMRDVFSAIGREKQIKGWTRAKKVALIESANPGWRDLVKELWP